MLINKYPLSICLNNSSNFVPTHNMASWKLDYSEHRLRTEEYFDFNKM